MGSVKCVFYRIEYLNFTAVKITDSLPYKLGRDMHMGEVSPQLLCIFYIPEINIAEMVQNCIIMQHAT